MSASSANAISALAPHWMIGWYLKVLAFTASFQPLEEHVELLFQRRLKVDALEHVARGLVNQVVGRTGIVHVAQFDQHLGDLAVLQSMRLRHMDRTWIEICRFQIPARIDTADL